MCRVKNIHDRWNVKVLPNIRLASKRLRLFIILATAIWLRTKSVQDCAVGEWKALCVRLAGALTPVAAVHTVQRHSADAPPSKSPPQGPGQESHPCVVCRCCVKSLSSPSYKHLGSLIQTSNQSRMLSAPPVLMFTQIKTIRCSTFHANGWQMVFLPCWFFSHHLLR